MPFYLKEGSMPKYNCVGIQNGETILLNVISEHAREHCKTIYYICSTCNFPHLEHMFNSNFPPSYVGINLTSTT
jgi:hypothetical protein